MPAHLIQAMPMLVLGLAGLAWIAARRVRLRRAGDGPGGAARRDFAVGLALAASWFSAWGLYATYTWTARPGIGVWQSARFYVPAIGAIALLGAWLAVRMPHVVRWPRRAPLAAAASAAVVVAMFTLGAWSFNGMLNPQNPGCRHHLIAILVNRNARSRHRRAGQEDHRRAEDSSATSGPFWNPPDDGGLAEPSRRPVTTNRVPPLRPTPAAVNAEQPLCAESQAPHPIEVGMQAVTRTACQNNPTAGRNAHWSK